MFLICVLAWKQRKAPDKWRRAIIVPLHKGKGSKNECNNYREISLLSVPGKVYGGRSPRKQGDSAIDMYKSINEMCSMKFSLV